MILFAIEASAGIRFVGYGNGLALYQAQIFFQNVILS
jgi:hypothetical protein